MKTARARQSILKAAVLVLVLGFMVTGATQAAASVVVRAKVGPVSVRVGNQGRSCCGPVYVHKTYRHRRSCRRTVVVARPAYCGAEAVWVPGHYKVKWNGRRKWVPGHWRLI